MIEKLGHSRIFDVDLSPDKKTLVITEACDLYFSEILTKSDVIELANDFLKLAEQMKDD